MNMKLSLKDGESLSPSDRKAISLMLDVQRALQNNLHETVEVQTVMFLLEVAYAREPIDLTTLGIKLGLSKSATSRNFYRLSDGKGGEGGLYLIESIIDYNDRRRVILKLTPKGLEVILKISQMVLSRAERMVAE